MNRTDTAPKVLKLLAEEKTIRQVSEEMGLSLGCAKAAIVRLRQKGKLDRRVDDLGYVRWKAKAERIPEGEPAA